MEARQEAGQAAAAHSSFAEWQAGQQTATPDGAAALALLAATGLILCLRNSTEEAPLLYVLVFSVLLCLTWCLSAPAAWHRHRVPVLVALRLALAAPSTRLLSAAYRAALSSDGNHASLSGPAAALFFVSTVSVSSGAAGLALCALGLPLPPLLNAAVQAAATALVARANPALCDSPYMRHAATAAGVELAYSYLEPAIAPLEPLLWAAGVGLAHPHRRCLCVIAALQVWGGLLLPLVAAAAAEDRAYRRYRFDRLRAALLRQRAEFRAEARRWTRAAAAARREAAQAAGLSPGDLGSSPSTGPSSPESAAEQETVAAQAAALLDAPAPPGLLAPGDWQHEAAHRALRALRALRGWAALPASAVACLLYAWHVLTFGGPVGQSPAAASHTT